MICKLVLRYKVNITQSAAVLFWLEEAMRIVNMHVQSVLRWKTTETQITGESFVIIFGFVVFVEIRFLVFMKFEMDCGFWLCFEHHAADFAIE